MQNIVTIPTIFADDSGETHFGAEEHVLEDAGKIGMMSPVIPAKGLIVRQTPEDYDYDFHPAPSDRYVVMIKGSVRFTVSSGESREFGPGDIVHLKDVRGKGHKSEAIDGVRESIFILTAA